MAESKIIDAHQHFWRYDPEVYGWIRQDVLQRDYLPEDLRTHLQAMGVDGTVLVEGGAGSLQDNEFMLGLAQQHDTIYGVVGWADVTAPDLAAQLEPFTGNRYFRGIRYGLGAFDEDGDTPPAALLRGLETLAELDLTFDLLLRPPQLPLASRLAEQVPQLQFVLDHIANPPIASGELEPWASGLRHLASFPNVACKVSGMITRAGSEWQAEDFTPYLDVVFDAFGPERLMFGSDWPVCLQAGNYAAVLLLVRNYIDALDSSAQEAVMGGTAQRIYQL